VNGTDDNGCIMGNSSCLTLQKALDTACGTNCNPKTIIVTAGVYSGVGNTNLVIGNCGSELESLSISITLQGQGVVVIDGQQQNKFLSVQRIGSFTVQGIQFINGFMNSTSTSDGLFLISTNARQTTIDSCAFSQSSGPSVVNWVSGGGLITGTSFDYNSATNGVVNVKGGSAVNIVSSFFRSNTGNALVAFQTVIVHHTVFQNNNAGTQGAVVCNNVVLDTTDDNQAWRYNNFTGNTGTRGGAVAETDSQIAYKNCLISGNVVSGQGGGLLLYNSVSTVSACGIMGNKAMRGGGVYITGLHSLTDPGSSFANNVISGNQASQSGGGVYCENAISDITSTTTIQNNTVTDVTAGVGPDFYCKGFCTTKQQVCACNGLATCDVPSTLTTWNQQSTSTTPDQQSSSMPHGVPNQAPFGVIAAFLTVTTIISIVVCGVKKPNKI